MVVDSCRKQAIWQPSEKAVPSLRDSEFIGGIFPALRSATCWAIILVALPGLVSRRSPRCSQSTEKCPRQPDGCVF